MTPLSRAKATTGSGIGTTCSRSSMRLLVLIVLLGFTLSVPTLAKDKKATLDADGWPEITKEERSLTSVPEAPDADAVVLRMSRDGKIVKPSDRHENKMQFHWRLKVLTKAGEEYGEVSIPAEKYSRVKNIEARTVKPDGTIVNVSPDQIFERVVFEVGSFKVTEKVFNFPAVEPGAILEYRYDRHSNFLWFLRPWYFEGEQFTLYSRVSQAIPNGISYMVLCDLCEGQQPQVTKWREAKAKGQLYTMEMKNLPGYRQEILMPPVREVSPRMEMVMQGRKNYYFTALGRQDRLFTDWNAVAKYAHYNYNEAIKKGQQNLKPLVESWVNGLASEEEKIQAVFRHVQRDFRYISYSNIGGFSASLESILKNKRADNEEKAVLLQAALQAIGVKGRIALVSGKDRGSLNPKFFSLSQFTHGVVLLSGTGGSGKILDPTRSYAPYGFMPWRDSGSQMLVLGGKEAELAQLPTKNELSVTKYDLTIQPKPDGKASLVLNARFSGEDAIDKREALAPAAEAGQRTYLQRWLDGLRSGISLDSFELQNLDNSEEALEIKIEATATGLVTLAGDIMAVRGCVLSGLETNPISRGSREHPFYVDRGLNIQENVRIENPEGMKMASLPLPSVARSPIGSVSMKCTAVGDEAVKCSRQFLMRRNRWDASERDNIRAMFEQIVEADQGTVAFETASAAGSN